MLQNKPDNPAAAAAAVSNNGLFAAFPVQVIFPNPVMGFAPGAA